MGGIPGAWKGFSVWTSAYFHAAVPAHAFLIGYWDRGRLSDLLGWKPAGASPGPWEVGRVAQQRDESHESGLSPMAPGARSEIRGGLDQISGFITCCPKLLLAKDEVLTCLAWLHFSMGN